MGRYRRFVRQALVASAGVVLAGTSTVGASMLATTAASAKGASGAPVRIMVLDTGGSTAASFGDIETAVVAKIGLVNAHGGSGGHHIALDNCSDAGDPNQAAGCARTAVSDGDVAVIAPLEINSDNVLPILEQAKIPYVAPTPISPADYTNADSFPLAGGEPVDYGGVGVLLATHGCKKVGIIYTATPSTQAGVPFITKGAEAHGAKIVAKVSVGATAQSVAPQVAQIEQKGAKCLAVAISPTQSPQIALAVKQSGQTLQIAGPTADFPQSVINSMGSAANGILLSGGEALSSDTSIAQVKAMVAAAKKYASNLTPPQSNFATDAWAGATVLLDDVIPHVSGTVTGAKVAAGIAKLKGATTGVIAPYTGTAKPPIAEFPRLLNYGALFWKVNDSGTPKIISHGFVNLAKDVS